MKQKLIIGFSLILLISAVILIGHDLFRKSSAFAPVPCCGDEEISLKKIDSLRTGYFRKSVFESRLKNLTGIAVTNNQIFVCGNRQVTVFDTSGQRIGGFITDSANSSMAVWGEIIYVASGQRVTGYDLDGNTKASIKSKYKNSFITSVSANDQFVLLADAVNKRVLKFTADGKFLLEIGKKDSTTGATGFIIPSAYFEVSTGGFDDMWTVNPGRREIENYSQSGNLRSSWGNTDAGKEGFTGCCNPAHMALLQDGSFVTYEKGVDKIKVFDATGRFRCYVAGAGSFRGKADFQLGRNNLVKDLTTDSKGNIYILDAYNRINIFKATV